MKDRGEVQARLLQGASVASCGHGQIEPSPDAVFDKRGRGGNLF